jgi:signal transduction histidine kinase/ActR/RegA family two-component response regulator/HPt (histidine-containing phosphotransfer) domain-containing protein
MDRHAPTVYHFLVICDPLGKRTIPLEADTYSIGRDARNSILVSSRAVSRHHATLIKQKEANTVSFRIVDGNPDGQRSTNGISINDRPCHTHHLKNGDRIAIGEQVQAQYFYATSIQALAAINPQLISAISTPSNPVQELSRRDRLLGEVIAARELHFPERIQRLLSMGCEWFGLEYGLFCEWSDNAPKILAQEHYNPAYTDQAPLNLSLLYDELFLEVCTFTVKHDSPIDYEYLGYIDLSQDISIQRYGKQHFRSCFSIRVISGNETHGLLCFGSETPTSVPFQSFQKDLLRFMAQWVGSEMERQQYQNALQKQLKQTVLLKQITQKIRGSLETSLIFQTTVDQVGKAFRASRCVLYTYLEDPKLQIYCAAEYLGDSVGSIAHVDIPVVNNPYGMAIFHQDTALASENVSEEPLLATVQSQYQQLDVKSMLAIRTSYQGNPNGMLTLHQCDRHRYWLPDEIELFEAVAAQVGIALAQAQLLEAKIAHHRQLLEQNKDLVKATRAAEAANEAKSEFLAMMSHEIRTPMNAVIGTLDLLHTTILNTQQAQYLDIIRSGSEALLTLLNDILDFSKIEAGKLEIDCHTFNLHTCITSAIALLTPQCTQKGINLTWFIDPRLPQQVEGDSYRLRQILTNLVSNAVKFTDAGQVLIRVAAYQANPLSPQHEILFVIHDTGIGISAQQQTTLFQPFSQVDTSITRKYGGTGLGLIISQQLANLMGGHLWVESRGSFAGDPPNQWQSLLSSLRQGLPTHSAAGPGSTFYFTIAANATASDDVASVSALKSYPQLELVSDLDGSKKTSVLLVEDNPVNQTVAQFMLKQLGYSYKIANNGAEAIEILRQTDYHLILMDVEMPVMDGISATQAIRQERSNPNLPYIIALTAYAMTGDRERCLKAGMQDYLTKPLRIQNLQTALKQGENSLSLVQVPIPFDSPPLVQDTAMILDRSVLDGFLQMAGPEVAVELLRELLEAYSEDVPQRLVDIETAIAQSNPEALRQSAHALRSSSINLGAVEVGELCRELEQIGKSGTTQGAQHLYPQLSLAIGKAIGALENTYQNLQLATV